MGSNPNIRVMYKFSILSFSIVKVLKIKKSICSIGVKGSYSSGTNSTKIAVKVVSNTLLYEIYPVVKVTYKQKKSSCTLMLVSVS